MVFWWSLLQNRMLFMKSPSIHIKWNVVCSVTYLHNWRHFLPHDRQHRCLPWRFSENLWIIWITRRVPHVTGPSSGDRIISTGLWPTRSPDLTSSCGVCRKTGRLKCCALLETWEEILPTKSLQSLLPMLTATFAIMERLVAVCLQTEWKKF